MRIVQNLADFRRNGLLESRFRKIILERGCFLDRYVNGHVQMSVFRRAKSSPRFLFFVCLNRVQWLLLEGSLSGRMYPAPCAQHCSVMRGQWRSHVRTTQPPRWACRVLSAGLVTRGDGTAIDDLPDTAEARCRRVYGYIAAVKDGALSWGDTAGAEGSGLSVNGQRDREAATRAEHAKAIPHRA